MFLLEEWVHEMLSEIEQKMNISNKMGEGVQQWLARMFCIFLSHRGKARTIKPKYFKSDPVAQQRGNPAP